MTHVNSHIHSFAVDDSIIILSWRYYYHHNRFYSQLMLQVTTFRPSYCWPGWRRPHGRRLSNRLLRVSTNRNLSVLTFWTSPKLNLMKWVSTRFNIPPDTRWVISASMRTSRKKAVATASGAMCYVMTMYHFLLAFSHTMRYTCL